MPDRLLDQFLNKGLLDLRGNDEWYSHIISSADSLAQHLRANPAEIIPFAYAALLPKVPGEDPAIAKALEILKTEWKTYASVAMGSPNVMLRAIILDALLTNSSLDDTTESTLAHLLASALPHLKVGKEAEVWSGALGGLLQAVNRKAESAWSVPSQISVQPFPEIDVPAIRVSVKGEEVNEQALSKKLFAAAGPNNPEGQATGGNPHWSNAAQNWSNEFVPRAVEAIIEAIDTAAGAKTASVKPKALTTVLCQAVADYLDSFVSQISSTTHGVEMRSRLLWWKEALVSPSSGVSYRDIDPIATPGLMAYDYQAILPSLAPASVSAFLRETVCTLQLANNEATLVDRLKALATVPHASELRREISSTTFADGYKPLIALVSFDQLTPDLVEKHSVFDSGLRLTGGDFAQMIFLELQAIKAAQEIVCEAEAREADSVREEQDIEEDA